MELENASENFKVCFECQSGKAGGSREALNPGIRVRPMELVRRNLSLVVISVLLGVCIFLSVIAIITAGSLTAGNHEKTLSAFAKIQDEILQLNKTAGNHEKTLSAFAKCQDEILQLNKTIKIFEQTLSSIAEIQDKISQLSKNTKTSIAGVKNELSQWQSSVAANLREMKGTVTKLQIDILQRSGNPLPCPTEWIRFNESCYHFSVTTKTWANAQRACVSLDAHLIVINNAEEQDFLRLNLENRYWIGLSDTASEGAWRWVDGTEFSSNFTFWSEGEPNDELSAEDCAETFQSGEWNDMPCSKTQRWICERPALNTSSI